jgi:hypothetical protein
MPHAVAQLQRVEKTVLLDAMLPGIGAKSAFGKVNKEAYKSTSA